MESDASHQVATELAALQDVQPLIDIISPLKDNVLKGLGAMGRIVGSTTETSNITPDLLAAAAAVKERCDREIVLPVMEINEHVMARRKDLEIMQKDQQKQLQNLQSIIKKMKERDSAIRQMSAVISENAKSLVQRSASVLQSATDLQPTITRAEYDYFQELKKLHEKTQIWEQDFERMDLKVSSLKETLANGVSAGAPVDLPPEQVEQAQQLLNACAVARRKQERTIEECGHKLDELAAALGMEREDALGQ